MNDRYTTAFEALAEAEVVIDRFRRFAQKQVGGHILGSTDFYDRQINAQGIELAKAVARLQGPLASIESEISALWPRLDQTQRHASATSALYCDDPLGRAVPERDADNPRDLSASLTDWFLKSYLKPNRGVDPPKAPATPDSLAGHALDLVTSQRRSETRFHQGSYLNQYSVEVFSNMGQVNREHAARVDNLTSWLQATRTFIRNAQSWLLWANMQIEDQKTVKGQTVITVKIGDNNTFTAPIAIADTIKDSLKHINTSTADDDLKAAVQDLIKAIAETGEALPADTTEDLAIDAEGLAREVGRDAPRKSKVKGQLDGLAQTAQALGKAALPILDAAAKVKALIGV
ncbi:hypothetical protein [Tropicimonas sp. S265A]|uniref:hypothetical protein n=1 Tax=Tropicimonas sp. S265A TaxID=3415134 RepID=UPI003C7CA6BF